jgi:hypothetical protein
MTQGVFRLSRNGAATPVYVMPGLVPGIHA